MGNDCSKKCRNIHANCEKTPGLPKFTCNYPKIQDVARRNCPAMCELCS